MELPATTTQPVMTVKLWARRVWTLELSLVRFLSFPVHESCPDELF